MKAAGQTINLHQKFVYQTRKFVQVVTLKGGTAAQRMQLGSDVSVYGHTTLNTPDLV